MNDIEPISHTSPYKRIDLNPMRLGDPHAFLVHVPYVDAAKRDAIWTITRQTAEGTNNADSSSCRDEK